MDIGSLNKRLTIRTNTPATDDGGGLVDSFANDVTVWGSVKPLRGAERQRAMAVDASISHMVRIRYNSRLDSADQITYNSRTFRVSTPINVDEASRVAEVMVSEVK